MEWTSKKLAVIQLDLKLAVLIPFPFYGVTTFFFSLLFFFRKPVKKLLKQK